MEPSSWGIYVVGTAVQSGGCSAGYHLNDFTQPGYMVCGEYTGWSVIVDINFPCPVFGSDAHTTYNTPDLMELVFFGWDYANPPKEFGYSSVIHMPAPGFTGGGWSFEGNPYNSCYLHMISTNSSPVYPPDPGTFHPVIPPSITLPFEWRPDDWRPRGKMPIGLRNVKTNATYTVQSKTGTGSWTTVTNLTPTHAMFGTNVTDYNVCWTTVPLSTNSTDPVLYRFYGTNYNQ